MKRCTRGASLEKKVTKQTKTTPISRKNWRDSGLKWTIHKMGVMVRQRDKKEREREREREREDTMRVRERRIATKRARVSNERPEKERESTEK